MMQSASVVGGAGGTDARRLLHLRRAGPDRRLRFEAIAGSAPSSQLAVAARGSIHTHSAPLRLAGGEVLSCRACPPHRQANDPQDERWQAEKADATMVRYVDLSGGGASRPAWPESPVASGLESAQRFPFLLTERPTALAAIADLLPEERHADHRRRARGPSWRTPTRRSSSSSIYIIGDDSEIRAAYDKVHLVPFGEYLPFGRSLRDARPPPVGRTPGRVLAGPDALRTLTLPGAPPVRTAHLLRSGLPRRRGRTGQPTRVARQTSPTTPRYGDYTGNPISISCRPACGTVEREPAGAIAPVRASRHRRCAPEPDRHRSLPLGRMGVLDWRLAGEPSTPTLYARFGDLIFLALTLLTTVVDAASGGS